MHRYALVTLIASLLLFVAGFFVHVLLFITGLLGIPLAGLLFGVDRYSKIILTAKTLQVGSEALPLAEIDPTFKIVTEKQWHAATGDWVKSPFRFRSSEVELLGGVYDKPIWATSVIIRTRNGELKAVASNNPDAFISALQSVVK